MKLRNLFILFAVLGVLLPGFSSCSSDDDDDKVVPQSALVGTWNLKISGTAASRAADVYFKINTSDATLNATLEGMIPALIGQAIAEKVDYVTVAFNADGTTKISFKELASVNPDAKEVVITDMVPIIYSEDLNNNKVTLAVEKAGIDQVLEVLKPSLGGISPDDIKAILVESADGKYYTLPLNVKLENNHIYFYISKDTIDKALPLLQGFMSQIPAELQPMIPAILAAQTLDFGLGFEKK